MYVREISDQLSKEINYFFQKFDTNMQLRLIHTTCKWKKLFPYKDKKPHLHQFNVIYKLKCDCGASHIGQTNRTLITRHLNRNIDSPLRQEIDLLKHQVDNPNHKIDFNNCAMLGFSNHWKKRLIKQSLYIQKFNPSSTKLQQTSTNTEGVIYSCFNKK